MSSVPRVVIIGGGFAGLSAARSLSGAPVEVVLVDRTNHHAFQPLLYQVAAAALSPRDVARPLRDVLRRQKNVTVLMADVVGLEPEERRIRLADDEELAYDYLIVAVGARHSYFGNDEWERYAPGLKTIEDALELRRRILIEFERAERVATRLRNEGREVDGSVAPSFLVVGGGPTGVEMAGAIAEIAGRTMLRDFRAIRPEDARTLLVEGAPRVLPPYPEELSEKAQQQLEELGVEVRVGTMVTGLGEDWAELEDESGSERISVSCVIWAAGNEVSELLAGLPAERDRNGRVEVEPDLSLARDQGIFVLGDAARCLDDDGEPLPGVAPVAMQQGRHAARNIRRELEGLRREEFQYTDRGSMATIGKARAVAWIGRLRFGGTLAWLAWCLVHILFLIGFRNRVLVMLEWIFLYVFHRRDARLVHGWSHRPSREPSKPEAHPPNGGPANNSATNHGAANHGAANHGAANHSAANHGPASYSADHGEPSSRESS